jgi:hypothetical protein
LTVDHIRRILSTVGESLFIEQKSAEAREAAAMDALSWGFPRPIYAYELEIGFWFRLGPSTVVWYENGGEDSNEYAVHVAVDPEKRFYWPSRSFLKGYLELAQSIGAHRLRFIPAADDDGVTRILERMGWQPDGVGLRLEVPQ